MEAGDFMTIIRRRRAPLPILVPHGRLVAFQPRKLPVWEPRGNPGYDACRGMGRSTTQRRLRTTRPAPPSAASGSTRGAGRGGGGAP